MIALFHAHSGLRYLVLLAGVVALAWFAFGLATGRAAGKQERIMGSVFLGLLDLQILLGVALVLMWPWQPKTAGHLAMMLLAAIAAHVLLAINRRRGKPGFALPLAAVAAALVLIVGGTYAIQRHPLQSTSPVLQVR